MNTDYQAMQALKTQLMKNVAELPLIKQFHMRLVKPDTWIIEPFCPSSDAPRVHLLIGETYALVIDPTDTPYDLRAYIQTYVTDKPLLVANTHSHNDHTYANYLFDDCTIYMSEICQQELRQARTHSPKLDALGHAYASYNEGTVVRPGDVIELGGRPVQVLGCTPCHAASSLLFLDEKAGILFTGDEIDAGQVNIWNQPVEVFRDNIVMLLGLRDRFDTICCPHNGTPMHADVLRYFLENCDRIMSGIEGDMDKGSTSYLLNPFEPRSPESVDHRRWDPLIRRSEWKSTAINYNIDLIFREQLKGPYRKADPHASSVKDKC